MVTCFGFWAQKWAAAQFDHLAGADEQDALLGNRTRRCARPDARRPQPWTRYWRRWRSLRTSLATEKERWNSLCSWCRGAVFLGGAHGVLHLAEDLRLADDHRVKAAGNAEGVADGFRLVMGIDVGRQFVARHLVVMGQPVDHHVGRLGGAVDLGAVAGGQDGHLAHRPLARQVASAWPSLSAPNATRSRMASGAEWWLMPRGKITGCRLAADEMGAIIASAPTARFTVDQNRKACFSGAAGWLSAPNTASGAAGTHRLADRQLQDSWRSRDSSTSTISPPCCNSTRTTGPIGWTWATVACSAPSAACWVMSISCGRTKAVAFSAAACRSTSA